MFRKKRFARNHVSCGTLNNWPPEGVMSYGLIPRPRSCGTLRCEAGFADVMKLTTLSWGGYPGGPSRLTSVLKSQKKEQKVRSERER